MVCIERIVGVKSESLELQTQKGGGQASTLERLSAAIA